MERLKKEKNEDFVNRLFQAHTINETTIAVNSIDPKTGKSNYKGTSFNKWLNKMGMGDLLKVDRKYKISDRKRKIKKAREDTEKALEWFNRKNKGGE